MEEKIQILITTIWEQSLNLENEELIIRKLNKICFQDPLKKDQISILNLLTTSYSIRLFPHYKFGS